MGLSASFTCIPAKSLTSAVNLPDMSIGQTVASIPLALDSAVRLKKIKKGSLVLLVAFGAGFTSGSVLLNL